MAAAGIFQTVVVGACPRCRGQVVGREDEYGLPTLDCLSCGWVDDITAPYYSKAVRPARGGVAYA